MIEKWKCQIPDAGLPVREGHEAEPDVLIDGSLKGSGVWCYMCAACHKEYGSGFGMGLGQVYKQFRDDKGDWRLARHTG